MIHIVLGSQNETKTVDHIPTSRKITASKVERRHVYYTPDSTPIAVKQGRSAWSYLHTTDDDPKVALVKFEAMIPSYGCACKKDYQEIKKEHPFDTSSPDAFWVSGVVIHNAVNRKLGKTEVSIDEARQIWNRPADESAINDSLEIRNASD